MKKLLFLALAIGMFGAVVAKANSVPVGWLDAIDNGTVKGWALDPLKVQVTHSKGSSDSRDRFDRVIEFGDVTDEQRDALLKIAQRECSKCGHDFSRRPKLRCSP